MARLQEVLQVFGSFEGTEAAGEGDGGAEAAHVAAAAAETLAAAGAAADDEAAPMDEEGGEVLSEVLRESLACPDAPSVRSSAPLRRRFRRAVTP
jgi:hypothetical protein